MWTQEEYIVARYGALVGRGGRPSKSFFRVGEELTSYPQFVDTAERVLSKKRSNAIFVDQVRVWVLRVMWCMSLYCPFHGGAEFFLRSCRSHTRSCKPSKCEQICKSMQSAILVGFVLLLLMLLLW